MGNSVYGLFCFRPARREDGYLDFRKVGAVDYSQPCLSWWNRPYNLQMFRDKTTFIVGAGASSEAGLPLGSALLRIVAQKLNFDFDTIGHIESGDRLLWEAFQKVYRNEINAMDRIISAGRAIARAASVSVSIDRLIDSFNEDPYVAMCGKAAITQTIQQKESSSPLMANPERLSELRMDVVSVTWYQPFAKALFDGVSNDNVDSVFDNISIVCFNYDRCIEHFLTYALSYRFPISLEEARRIVNERLTIHHPYGMVGKLAQTEAHIGRDFGRVTDGEVLIEASKGIVTFTEQGDTDTYAEIKDVVRQAETLVFLGFGYLEDNLRLIGPEPHQTDVSRIFATVSGISKGDIDDVVERVLPLVGKHMTMTPGWYEQDRCVKFASDGGGCKELFDEYWMNLTSR